MMERLVAMLAADEGEGERGGDSELAGAGSGVKAQGSRLKAQGSRFFSKQQSGAQSQVPSNVTEPTAALHRHPVVFRTECAPPPLASQQPAQLPLAVLVWCTPY